MSRQIRSLITSFGCSSVKGIRTPETEVGKQRQKHESWMGDNPDWVSMGEDTSWREPLQRLVDRVVKRPLRLLLERDDPNVT